MMPACEHCWAEAYRLSRVNGTAQVDEYRKLIATECLGESPSPKPETPIDGTPDDFARMLGIEPGEQE